MIGTISRAASRVAGGRISGLVLMPVSAEARLIGLALVVGAVLYTVFFSGIGPVHDVTHEIRHSMLSVPCH